MNHETGTLLWGKSLATGNIWIVVNGLSQFIGLLFDGKNKRFCDDKDLTKYDYIKSGSTLQTVSTFHLETLVNTYGPVPHWAQILIDQKPLATPPPLPVATLPAAVIAKIETAIGRDLTSKPEPVILRHNESKCPMTGGDHNFVPYTGLAESFEFCTHCDSKRKTGVKYELV